MIYMKTIFSAEVKKKIYSLFIHMNIVITVAAIAAFLTVYSGSKGIIINEYEKYNIKAYQVKAEEGSLFDMTLVNQLKNDKNSVNSIIPCIIKNADIKVNSKHLMARANFTESNYYKMNRIKFLKGRKIVASDLENKNNVICINEITSYKLYNRLDVIGECLEVDIDGKKIGATIIGVYQNPLKSIKNYLSKDFNGYEVMLPLWLIDYINPVEGFDSLILNFNNSDKISTPARIDHLISNFTQSPFIVKELKLTSEIDEFINDFYFIIAIIFIFVIFIMIFSIMITVKFCLLEKEKEIILKKLYGINDLDNALMILNHISIKLFIYNFAGILIGFFIGSFISKLLLIIPSINIENILMMISATYIILMTFCLKFSLKYIEDLKTSVLY